MASPDAVIGNLSDHWSPMLSAVLDAAMFKDFLAAVEWRQWPVLRRELVRRLPRARKPAQSRILLLYLATVRYLLYADNGGGRFQKLKASIPREEIEPVRLAAERLADAVRNGFVRQLALALRNFEFDALDEWRGYSDAVSALGRERPRE